jgi:hypothetical protein
VKLIEGGMLSTFQSFALSHNIRILVWSPLANGFLTGKYSRANPAPAGTRFAEALCHQIHARRAAEIFVPGLRRLEAEGLSGSTAARSTWGPRGASHLHVRGRFGSTSISCPRWVEDPEMDRKEPKG